MYSIILLIVLAYLGNVSTSRLQFQATPREIMQNITDSVTLTCSVTDSPATPPNDVIRHISSIYILGPDGVDIASVTAYDAATALVNSTHVNVKGSVSALSGEGSLVVTWHEASTVPLGQLTCTVTGIDVKGHQMQLTSELVMTSVTPTMLDLINDIKQKMATQQQQHRQEKNEIHRDIVSLQQDNSQLHQDIDSLQQNNSQLHQDIVSLQHVNSQLEDKFKNCSTPVAFHAYMTAGWSFSAGNTVQFQTTKINYGSGYSNATGIFTCPRSGVYIFYCSGTSYSSSRQLFLRMVMNNDDVSSLTAGWDHDNYDASTMTVTLHMNAGDTMQVVARLDSYFRSWDSKDDAFSGHLLYADGC